MTSFRPRVYVAGKYSAPTPEGCLANTRRAMEVGIHLWRKGYAPFIPHLSHFTDELATELGLPIGYQEWLAWDDAYQVTCHAFFYDSSSSGADREYANAQLIGQPVFRKLEDVPLAQDLLHYLRPLEGRVEPFHHQGMVIQQEVLIQRLPHGEGLPIPQYQSAGAAGADLYAATPEGEEQAIYPNETAMIPTGIAVAIPAGYAGLILPRSSVAARDGVTLANAPGLIDSDYRGEIILPLHNFGDKVFNFRRGVRLAQFVLVDVNRAIWSNVVALPESIRGEGGFGSTGAV